MNILISEDNDKKFEQIKKHVEVIFNNEHITITRKIAINPTLNELLDNKSIIYDFLLQDMQLPRYEDNLSKIVSDGGIQTIRYLKRKKLNNKLKILIISSENQKEKLIQAGHEDIENITFSFITNHWKIELEKFFK